MKNHDDNLFFRGMCDAVDFKERECCKFYIQYIRNTASEKPLEFDCWWRKKNNTCFNVNAADEKKRCAK